MNWRRLSTYIIFIGLFSPLWLWVTVASDGRFLGSLARYGNAMHVFALLAYFSLGLLATVFVFQKSRESGHNMKWLACLLFIFVVIAIILIPSFSA